MQECCVTFPTMHAVVLLGTAILIGLIVVDWLAFNRQSTAFVRYGMVVGRREEPLVVRAGGAFLGVALSGLGVLVCLFGLVVVVAAYRLEDKWLMALYDELRGCMNA